MMKRTKVSAMIILSLILGAVFISVNADSVQGAQVMPGTVTANYVSEQQPTISAPVIVVQRLDKQVVMNVTISNLNVEDRVIILHFRLCYDDTLLRLENAAEGPFMQDPRWNLYGTNFMCYNDTIPFYDQYTPSVIVTIVLAPNPNDTAYIWDAFPFGSGVLATLTFTPLIQQRGSPLTCSLHLVQNEILDDNGNDVLSSTMDGLYMMLPTNVADMNNDYKVDIKDVSVPAKAFGTVPGDSRWNPIADVTGPTGVPDSRVDIRDIAFVAHNFGWAALDP